MLICMAPPRPYRPVFRAFDRIIFDQGKSDMVYDERDFDLAYVSRIFPGFVLEREDNRPYGETRYRAIGELPGEVYIVVYTRSGRTCRLITAWVADPEDRELWYDFR